MPDNTYSFFAPDEHLFFNDLVVMIMALSSYMFTLDVFQRENNPIPIENRKRDEWISCLRPLKDMDFPFPLDAYSISESFIFFPASVIAEIGLHGWPKLLMYRFQECKGILSGSTIKTPGHIQILTHLVGDSFLSFYESIKDTLDKKYGAKSNWPALMNFARHIRNGFAHGGSYNIVDSNIPPITWRKCNIDSSRNRQPILFTKDGLGIGDIILLMDDVNLELKR